VFTSNNGTFQVLRDAGLHSDTGIASADGPTISSTYYYPYNPIISNGSVLVGGASAKANSEKVLFEIAFSASGASIEKAVTYPAFTDPVVTWGGYFAQPYETPSGINALYGANNGYIRGLVHWKNILGDAPTYEEIAPPTTHGGSGSFAGQRFQGQYPWITANYFYEATLSDPTVFFNNSAWIAIDGEVPNLDGELSEQRRKFWRNRPY
jgi:hypothetical protein